jgi:hypothetical protein
MDPMRTLIAAGAVVLAFLLGVPGTALASPKVTFHVTSTANAGVALPIAAPPSPTTPPAGFTSNARQAIKAAELNPTMLALHAREHPLSIEVWVWSGANWFVDFSYQGKRVAEVVETRSARVTKVWTGPLAVAVYARGDFAPLFGSASVLVPFSLLFLLPFLDPRRLRRMLHLDALVLESFLVSYLLFDHAQLVPAVWMAYPPLLYLLARLLWIGWGHRADTSAAARRAGAALAPLLSVRVLAAGLIALVAVRTGLSLFEHDVVDVGYASVIGAHRIVNGQSLYYATSAGGDTYGPIAYLAYVPFELLFPWHGAWDYLASAHAASIFFDLVTILGLVVLGRRLRPGPEGLRLGLALGWAWAACPFTLLALMMHSNDGLIAMLSVLSLLVFGSPAARGAVLGLAAAAKFAPAALLGLYAGQRDRGRKGTLQCLGAFALVAVSAIALYLPSGGLSEFYHHTLGFQLTRSDVFSPWGLHPGLVVLKTALELAAIALFATLAFVPRRRSLTQVCALAGAVTIAVQVPAVHWFYYFIVWFMPFALVAFLAPSGDDGEAGEAGEALVAVTDSSKTTAEPAPEAVAAGA